MTKIAVIKTGGKQYKVKEGDVIKIEKLPLEDGKKVKFETLMIADTDGSSIEIGAPFLGEKVEGETVSQGRAKKILVIKYKNKTRYKRTIGHRQEFSQVKIEKIA
ncbi:50S ribosomal protein L21 [Candidatus Falkowbacteria bacterium HGW-Falkowbacteria-1]|uniref:Large ribosomal subunit protein bL21 n=1 Tax=Candidatus Falkowbacteria bacterium HGW-Falkowbacteria-1 TaxID=2013768 RepID=A0A2N2EAI0_9BACT|nr:MAG: 50S ribosomal protein L21 [Candidatus Falkowbacteria bacterium HGW-Falkowbacteria-1]